MTIPRRARLMYLHHRLLRRRSIMRRTRVPIRITVRIPIGGGGRAGDIGTGRIGAPAIGAIAGGAAGSASIR